MTEVRPRCVSKAEAARYSGCRTLSAFQDRVRRGLLPPAIPGTHSWDLNAIDAVLDKASGLKKDGSGTDLDRWLDQRARAS